MKAAIIIAVIAFFMLSIPGYAQLGSQKSADFSDNETTAAEREVAEQLLPKPRLLPDHPLYFLKRLKEKAQLAAATGQQEKAELHLKLARERLAETKKLAEKGKGTEAAIAAEKYGSELESFEKENKNQSLENEKELLVSQSSTALNKVIMQVPRPAKEAIEKSLSKALERKAKEKESSENKAAVRERKGKERNQEQESEGIGEQQREEAKEAADEKLPEPILPQLPQQKESRNERGKVPEAADISDTLGSQKTVLP